MYSFSKHTLQGPRGEEQRLQWRRTKAQVDKDEGPSGKGRKAQVEKDEGPEADALLSILIVASYLIQFFFFVICPGS